MNRNLIFLPVLLQVLVTLSGYVMLSRAKTRAANAGLVDVARRGLYDDAWPINVQLINNNIRNQFELPVLFYVLVLMHWALGATDVAIHVAAWLFALSRVAHAYVHTGSNEVPLRRRIFIFGFVMIVVLLLSACVRVLMG